MNRIPVQLTKNNDDDICVYRSILLKRAKNSSQCPDGSLRQRRTTSQGESHTRYAQDCYLLQHFISNNDPKLIADMFTKRKMSVRSVHPTQKLTSNSQQIEQAELKTRINLLTQDVTELKQQRNIDASTIEKLSNDLEEMKTYTANLLQSFNRQSTYHMHLIDFLKAEVVAFKKNVAFIENSNNSSTSRTVNGYQTTSNTTPSPTEPQQAPIQEPQTRTTTDVTSESSLFKSIERQKQQTEQTKHNGGTASNSDSGKDVYIAHVTHEDTMSDTENVENANDISDKVREQKRNVTYADVVINGSKATENNQQEPLNINVQVMSRRNVKYNNNRKQNQNINTRQKSHTSSYNSNEDTFKSASNRTSYNRRQWQAENDVEPVFESIRSRKTRRYYVGGIATYSNRSGIMEYLKSKGITPESIKLIDTQRGSLAAKVTLYEEDWDTVERKEFWPRRVYCRKWYSEAEWESLLHTTADREHSNEPGDVD